MSSVLQKAPPRKKNSVPFQEQEQPTCFAVSNNKELEMSTACRPDKSLPNDGATKEKDAEDFQEMPLREKAKAQSSEESVFVQKQGQADVSSIHTHVHTIPLWGEHETRRSDCLWG